MRTYENWETWDMDALINNLRQWQRHKDDAPEDSGDVRSKREKHWYRGERKDLSVSFVKESTGQTRVKLLQQWKQGGSFSMTEIMF